MNFLLFFILQLVNVIFSTVRSLVLIKGKKFNSALISGAYFAYYTIIMYVTVTGDGIIIKAILTFITNVIGVYLVKLYEEKKQGIKLYRIEATLPQRLKPTVEGVNVPHSMIDIDSRYAMLVFYATTKTQTATALEYIDYYNLKYNVTKTI